MQLIVHVYGKAILVNSDDPNFAKKFQLKQRITKILSFEVLTMSVNEISIVLACIKSQRYCHNPVLLLVNMSYSLIMLVGRTVSI